MATLVENIRKFVHYNLLWKKHCTGCHKYFSDSFTTLFQIWPGGDYSEKIPV